MSSSRSAGFIRIPNAATGVEALGLYTKDPAERTPYVFGLGVNDTGRISTGSRAGASVVFPDDYSFGEAWELRFTFEETGNTAKNGIYVNVRTTAANTSGIRGMEMGAEQSGAIAVGGLEGANFWAGTRSTSTGNIGYVYGLTGETKHNSADYTGTITDMAAVRGKVSFEDGATYTQADIFRAEIEPASGGGAINSVLYAKNNDGSAATTVNYLIDTSGLESTNYSANRVVLWKFKDAGGTDRFLIFDSDAATSVLVDTNETE